MPVDDNDDNLDDSVRVVVIYLYIFIIFLSLVVVVIGPVDHITTAFESLKTSDESDEQKMQQQQFMSSDRPSEAIRKEPLARRPDSLTGLSIQQVHRKHELCQRHIQQLFIRGEQVALVAVLPL